MTTKLGIVRERRNECPDGNQDVVDADLVFVASDLAA